MILLGIQKLTKIKTNTFISADPIGAACTASSECISVEGCSSSAVCGTYINEIVGI